MTLDVIDDMRKTSWDCTHAASFIDVMEPALQACFTSKYRQLGQHIIRLARDSTCHAFAAPSKRPSKLYKLTLGSACICFGSLIDYSRAWPDFTARSRIIEHLRRYRFCLPPRSGNSIRRDDVGGFVAGVQKKIRFAIDCTRGRGTTTP